MSFNSVTGKNWKFKKYNSADITQLSENFSLTETRIFQEIAIQQLLLHLEEEKNKLAKICIYGKGDYVSGFDNLLNLHY